MKRSIPNTPLKADYQFENKYTKTKYRSEPKILPYKRIKVTKALSDFILTDTGIKRPGSTTTMEFLTMTAADIQLLCENKILQLYIIWYIACHGRVNCIETNAQYLAAERDCLLSENPSANSIDLVKKWSGINHATRLRSKIVYGSLLRSNPDHATEERYLGVFRRAVWNPKIINVVYNTGMSICTLFFRILENVGCDNIYKLFEYVPKQYKSIPQNGKIVLYEYLNNGFDVQYAHQVLLGLKALLAKSE